MVVETEGGYLLEITAGQRTCYNDRASYALTCRVFSSSPHSSSFSASPRQANIQLAITPQKQLVPLVYDSDSPSAVARPAVFWFEHPPSRGASTTLYGVPEGLGWRGYYPVVSWEDFRLLPRARRGL